MRKHRRKGRPSLPAAPPGASPPRVLPDPTISRESPRPERPAETSTWSAFDADATHGISQVFRGFIGLVAALLGGLIVYGLVKDGAAMASSTNTGPRGPEDPILLILIFVVAAPILLAFALGQALHFMWVGGDEEFDRRLWARLSAAARGERVARAVRKAIWSYAAWWWLTLGGLLYAQWLLRERVAAGLLALRWQAAVPALLTVALLWLGFRMRPRIAGAARPAQPGAWLSRTRWELQAPRAGWLDKLVAFTPAAALAAAAWAVPSVPSRDPLETAFYAVAAAVAFAFAWSETRRAARDRLAGSRLELERVSPQPLRLRGTVRFAAALEGSNARWVVELRGRYGRYGRLTFARVSAPLTLSADHALGRFELEIALPAASDYPVRAGDLAWYLNVCLEGAETPVVSFLVPQDATYPEEYSV